MTMLSSNIAQPLDPTYGTVTELKKRCDWVKNLLLASGVAKVKIDFCRQVVERIPFGPRKDSPKAWAEKVGYAILDEVRQSEAEDGKYQPAVFSRLRSLDEGASVYTLRDYTPTDELTAVTPDQCDSAHRQYEQGCDRTEAEAKAAANDTTPAIRPNSYADTFDKLEAEEKAKANRLKAIRETYSPIFRECFRKSKAKEGISISQPGVAVWALCYPKNRGDWNDRNECPELDRLLKLGEVSSSDIADAQDEMVFKIWDEIKNEVKK